MTFRQLWIEKKAVVTAICFKCFRNLANFMPVACNCTHVWANSPRPGSHRQRPAADLTCLTYRSVVASLECPRCCSHVLKQQVHRRQIRCFDGIVALAYFDSRREVLVRDFADGAFPFAFGNSQSRTCWATAFKRSSSMRWR